MLLIYTEGVSILNVFITEDTFCSHYWFFFVCLPLGNLGEGHCRKFLDFQIGFISVSPKEAQLCLRFVHLACVYGVLMTWMALRFLIAGTLNISRKQITL